MLDFKFTLSTHTIYNARPAHAIGTLALQALPTIVSLLEFTHHLLCYNMQLS